MPYKIINWEKFQARTERGSNPWVKLHRTILLSADFFAIPKVRRWEWPLLLLLANHATGVIEEDDHAIAFKLRYKDWETVPWDCKPFIGGLLETVDTSGIPLATNGNQMDTNGCLEERRGEEIRGEENKRSSYSEDFEIFWKASPRTGNKKRAATQWANLTVEQRQDAGAGVIRQRKWREAWAKADAEHFIPSWKHMERWLRDEQWEDFLDKPKIAVPKHMDESERDRLHEQRQRMDKAREADEAQAKRVAANIAAKGEGTTPDGPQELGPSDQHKEE